MTRAEAMEIANRALPNINSGKLTWDVGERASAGPGRCAGFWHDPDRHVKESSESKRENRIRQKTREPRPRRIRGNYPELIVGQ
jgi:hypothetical protein